MNHLKIFFLLAITGLFLSSAVNQDKPNKEFCTAFQKARTDLPKLLSTYKPDSTPQVEEKDLFPGATGAEIYKNFISFTMYTGPLLGTSQDMYDKMVTGLKECKPAGWEEDEYDDKEMSIRGFIIYDKQYAESEGTAGNSVSVNYEYPYYEEDNTYTVELLFSGQ
jgi:hypothetical protein